MKTMKTIMAINKKTKKCVYPRIANKKDEYVCPDCQKDVIVRQGNRNRYHFAHKKSDNPCNYYGNSPSESQIHKDAKMLLKTLLEKKTISFIRECCDCKKNEEFEIPGITQSSSIQMEYKFEYEGTKIADVVYIDNEEIVCIFEIVHTHKTDSENRPEPWFEIEASTLIESTTSTENSANNSLKIKCERCEKCDRCNEEEIEFIENKQKATDILYNWFHDGNEILPFRYDYAKFASVKQNTTCYLGENYDLILYVDSGGHDEYERYCIRLINSNHNYYFTKEHEYAQHQNSVYYLDIDWVLSQQTIPEEIKYIAGFDCYIYNKEFGKRICSDCNYIESFWVKRIFSVLNDGFDGENYNYDVIDIWCSSCGYNINNNNKKFNQCRSCNLWFDIDIIHYFCDKCKNSIPDVSKYIWIDSEHEAKMLNAKWNRKYKLWFIWGCSYSTTIYDNETNHKYNRNY